MGSIPHLVTKILCAAGCHQKNGGVGMEEDPWTDKQRQGKGTDKDDPVRTWKKIANHLRARREASGEGRSTHNPHIKLLSSEMQENKFLFLKPAGLWYFVTGALESDKGWKWVDINTARFCSFFSLPLLLNICWYNLSDIDTRMTG